MQHGIFDIARKLKIARDSTNGECKIFLYALIQRAENKKYDNRNRHN